MKTILDYADLVKEQHALNTTIAPVETDLTSASKAYAVGQKFIHDGVLYQAKTAIAQGAALVLNTNYEAADDVSSEIQTLTNNLSDEVEVRAKLGAHNLVDINGFTLIKSSARTKYIYPSDIIHGAIPSEQVVISFKVTNSNLSKSDNYFKAYGSNGEIGAVSFKANGRYSFVFDGASFNSFYIFISSNAESDETCTISEIMITLATDAYSEYVPYAMTNRELSETYDDLIASSRLNLHRVGKVVNVSTVGNAVVSDLLSATVPEQFRPRVETSIFCYVIVSQNRYLGRITFAPNGAISTIIQINSDGTITTLSGSELIQTSGTWLL